MRNRVVRICLFIFCMLMIYMQRPVTAGELSSMTTETLRSSTTNDDVKNKRENLQLVFIYLAPKILNVFFVLFYRIANKSILFFGDEQRKK